MASRTVKLTNRYGLHMRPAQLVVEVANSFPCEIDLIGNGRTVDAKSILAIIGLEAACEDEVQIEARGECADEAVVAVSDLLMSLPEFDEAAKQMGTCGTLDASTGKPVDNKPRTPSARRGPDNRGANKRGRRPRREKGA